MTINDEIIQDQNFSSIPSELQNELINTLEEKVIMHKDMAVED